MRTLNNDGERKDDIKSSDRRDKTNLSDDLKTLDSDWKEFENDLDISAPKRKKKYRIDDYDEEEDDEDFGLRHTSKPSIIPIVIGLIVVGGIGGYLYFQSKQITDTPSNVSPSTSTVSSSNRQSGSLNNRSGNNVNFSSSNNSDNENISEGTLVMEGSDGTTTTIENGSDNANGNTGSSVGLPDMNKTTGDKTNSTTVTDYSKFVNSFSGKEEAVDYDVSKISTSTDFVNYTKYRSVTGEGTEIYWLDAIYKDRPYTIITSYQIFRTLDSSGIVPVNVEKVTLKDGEEIVTSITVKTDYDKKQ